MIAYHRRASKAYKGIICKQNKTQTGRGLCLTMLLKVSLFWDRGVILVWAYLASVQSTFAAEVSRFFMEFGLSETSKRK